MKYLEKDEKTVKPKHLLKNLHALMNGKKENFFESSIGSLDKMFSDIADKIAYSATNVKLNLEIPDGIRIKKFKNSDKNIIIPLNNIVYTEKSRYGNTVTYHAEPIKFDFIINGEEAGDYTLNSKITFIWNGEKKELPINPLKIKMTDPKVPKLTLKASDSAKNINYDSSISQDDINENYKLYGKSNIQIDVKDVDATHLRYRFIKENEELKNEEWKEMELNSENDIDKANENHLTHMPYDVSQMPLRTNEEMWNNRHEVFKNPFLDEITQISTTVSDGRDYVSEEEVKKNAQMITRWAPKTLFLENYDVSSYAPHYKEASKTWGYITVPKDGEYTFKAVTDDGFYGNITVDGECKVISDAFKVKWFKEQPPASKPIKLKAGKYYAVYFEYFNWGGGACYKIECSINGDKEFEYEEIGKFGIKFYPSKSDLPKDKSNNGFMGNKTIDMPTEFGKYTFEYELIKYQDDSRKSTANYEKKGEGKFGTFEIEERFDLERYFLKDGHKQNNELEIEKNENFDVEYRVQPRPILISELYKGSESNTRPNLLYVKNISVEDSLPQGVITEIDTENDNKKEETTVVNFTNRSLEYKLEGDKYVASPFTVKANIKCKPNVNAVINFNTTGKINYRDASLDDNLRISQTQHFTNNLVLKIKEESEITKHGILDGNKIKYLDEIKSNHNTEFKSGMNYNLGFIINAKGTNNNFKIITSDAQISSVYLYELNLDDEIDFTKKMQIENIGQEGNGYHNSIKNDKKYAVVYSVTVNSNISQSEFIAKLDTGSEKTLTLKVNEKLPDLF